MAVVSITTKLTGVSSINAGLRSVEKSFANLAKRAGEVGRTMTTRVSLPILGLGALIVKVSADQERAVAQVEAAIRSTEGVAGVTTKSLQRMAAELQKTSTFGDEVILSAQSQLLTFTNVSVAVFEDVTKAVLNLSARMDQDLRSSVIQLGKAINDPVKNLSALSRVGIQFTDQQTEMIKALVETGDLISAQKIILLELERQFGGSAKAARENLGGALIALKNAVGDLLESIGEAGLSGAIRSTAESMRELAEAAIRLPPAVKITGIVVLGLVAAIGPLALLVALVAKSFAILIPILASVGVAFAAINITTVLVVAGIVALAGAAAVVIISWEKLGDATSQIWGSIKLTVLGTARDIVDGLDGVVAEFLGLDDNLAEVRDKLDNLISEQATENIKAGGQSMKEALVGVYDTLRESTEELVEDLKNTLITPFTAMEEEASSAATSTVESVTASTEEIKKKLEELGIAAIAKTKKAAKADKEASEKSKQLAFETLNFQIELGRKELEDRILLLREKLEVMKEGSREELEVRRAMARTIKEIADREAELIIRNTALTEEEMVKRLQILRRQFEKEGELGGLAIKELDREIRGLEGQSEQSTERMKLTFLDFNTTAFNVAGSIQQVFRRTFQDLASGAITFGSIFKTIFSGIIGSVLDEFAKLAADTVFQILFTGTDVGAGRQAGQQVLEQSGGSLFGGGTSGLGLAGFFSPTASSVGFGVETIFGAVAGEAAGNLALSLGKFGPALVAGIPGLIGAILRRVVGGTVGRILGGLGGALSGFLVGGPIGAVIGGLLGGFFQTGGSGIVTSPSLIAVGEHGPERFSVRPLVGAAGSAINGVTIIIQGDLITDDLSVSRLARRIAREIERDKGFLV